MPEQRTMVFLFGLALVCLAEFLLNLRFNSEIFAWQPHTLDIVNSVDGEVVLVNGAFVRNEGLTNVANTWFFSGGSASPSLGYELAISRLLAPFFASLFSILTPDPLSALVTANVVTWILAVWMAFSLGARILGDARVGAVFGLLVATSLGYMGTVLGTKAHLIGYTYFLALLYVAGRLGVHDRQAPRSHYIALGLMNALGAFANSVFLPFSTIAVVIGLYRRVRLVNLALVILPPFIATSVMRLLLSGLYPGSTGIDRSFGTLVMNALRHMQAVLTALLGKGGFHYELITASGTPLIYGHPLGPFAWFPAYAQDFALLCGVPFTLIALLGLATPKAPATRLGVVVILVQFVQMFLVQTYWPYQSLSVYAVYTSAFGFLLLAAQGIVNTGRWATVSAHWAMPGRLPLDKAAMASLLLILIAFNNQHLLFGREIEFIRFHTRHTTPFPSDWPFGIERW